MHFIRQPALGLMLVLTLPFVHLIYAITLRLNLQLFRHSMHVFVVVQQPTIFFLSLALPFMLSLLYFISGSPTL